MRTQRFQQFMNRFRQDSGLHSPRVQTEFANIVNAAANNGGIVSTLRAQIHNSTNDTVEFMFHDAIGDHWTGSDSDTVVRAIKNARDRKIKCDMNSFGGDAYAGIAIYNALVAHNAEVEIVVSGIAYSAASIIAMAGDTIKIAANGTLGIHPASLLMYGNKYDMDHYRNWLDSIDNGIIDTYAARSGQPRNKIADWFVGSNNDGSFFNGNQAVEYGFCDEILPLKKKDEDTHDSAGNTGSTSPESHGATPKVPEHVLAKLKSIQQSAVDEAAKGRRAKLAAMAASSVK